MFRQPRRGTENGRLRGHRCGAAQAAARQAKRRAAHIASIVLPLVLLCAAGSAAAGQTCTHPLFGAPAAAGTGVGVEAVEVGDLDGDSDLDLAAAGVGQSVVVLLNNGDGTYSAPVLFSAGGATSDSTAIADLDGIQGPDISVTLDGNDAIAVLLNNGDGTFSAPVLYGTGGDKPQFVTAGDLDGVLGPDLVVVNTFGGTVAVLLNQGGGIFAAPVTYSTGGGSPEAAALGDLDGDSDLDMAIVNAMSNNISVLRNTGNGTFVLIAVYGAGNAPWSLAMGDLEGDSDLDLAVANRFSDDVSVLLGNGNGTFAPHVLYGAGDEAFSVAAGDLDGDSNPDLAVANRVGDSVSVLLGNGDGTFASQFTYGVGDQPMSIAAGHLDGDVDLDLVTANYLDGTVSVLLNLCVAAPPNDDCADAAVITGTVFDPPRIDTSDATVEPSEVTVTCGAAGDVHTVWFQYEPTVNGTAAIDTLGSDYDTVLTVFDSTCGGAVAETIIACNDDAGPSVDHSEVNYLFLVAGVSYLIRVASSAGGLGGLLDFNFAFVPTSAPPDGRWTIISHGAAETFQPSQPFDLWMLQLALHIDDLDPDVVRIHTINRDTLVLADPMGNPDTPADIEDPTRHHVLLWDWSPTSFIIDPPPLETGDDGFAFAAGDALYGVLKQHGIHDKVQCFIGHSRGSVVVSETTRRLVLDGFDPRQVIYLDGEGGDFFDVAYEDDLFDGWQWTGPDAIRYDWIYSTVHEGFWVAGPSECPIPPHYCYCGFNLGGPECGALECLARLNHYDLGDRYRHGHCQALAGGSPPPIWENLIESTSTDRDGAGLAFDGGLYHFRDQPSLTAISAASPEQWHGHGADRQLFNGDFEWNSVAGWLNHGGGGTGHVDNLGEPGYYLELDAFDRDFHRFHSYFWLRDRYETLRLRYRVADEETFGCDDVFQVTLSQWAAVGPPLEITWQVVDRCAVTDWAVFSVQVPEAFRGSLSRIRLWKDAGPDGDIGSTVRVDDVSFRVAGDIDADDIVGINDLLALLAAWGPCGDCDDCATDLDGDCDVGVTDLLIVLANWG